MNTTEEQAWKVIAEINNQDEQYWQDVRNHYVNSLKKQDLAVPQFVSDWYEERKNRLEYAIYAIFADITRKPFAAKREDYSEIEYWFNYESNKPIETVMKMKDGYRIEEVFYWVVMPGTGQYLTLEDGQYSFDDKLDFVGEQPAGITQTFTKSQIEKLYKRYMDFAVLAHSPS